MTVIAEPDCTLRHKGEILAIIERMKRDRALTTVEFGDGNAIVSSVLEVRRDANAIIFDVARDPDQNRQLFASQSLAFVTELDHIRIAFATRAASLVALGDGPAAVVDMPNELVRLQRREWFRAALPTNPPIRCTVLDADGNAMPAMAVDLSCGGAAVLVDDPASCRSKAGTAHELILSLPEIGRLELHATLRTVTPLGRSAPNGKPGNVRMGFRFEALPPKTASQIQRYVQHIEVHQLRVLRLRD